MGQDVEKVQRMMSLLEAYRQEYQYLCENWQEINRKAQFSITASLIFISIIVAFGPLLEPAPSPLVQGGVAVVLLPPIVAVVKALGVLTVRYYEDPPMGDPSNEWLEAIENGDSKALVTVLHKKALKWQRANLSQFHTNEEIAKDAKSAIRWVGYTVIVTGAVGLAIVLVEL